MIRCSFDGIEFDILGITGTDWDIPAARHKEHVPYSNITIVEHTGHGLARVTWDLLFHRRDDYFAFLARYGQATPGTLMVPAGLQSLKGTVVTRGNPPVWMDVLDNVAIDEIGRRTLYRSGKAKVEVTFERAVDPISRTAVVP